MSNGKGDRNRSDNPKFKEEYERIFGKKCTLNHKHDEECTKPTTDPCE